MPPRLARRFFLHAVDQNYQCADRQNSGNHSNQRYVIHIFTSKWFNNELTYDMAQGLTYRNQSGSDYNNSHCWENEKYERRHKLDGGFRRHLFRLLPALNSQCIRKIAQGFGDGRAEAVRLDQHGHE